MITCEDCKGDKNGKCPNGRFAFDDMEICPLFKSHEPTRPRFCKFAKSPSAMAELLVEKHQEYSGIWIVKPSRHYFDTKDKAIAYAVKWLLETDEVKK